MGPKKPKILTMLSTENPFVHLIRFPDDEEVCFTGNENVKPSSLLSFCEVKEKFSSLSTKSFNDVAIKSKSAFKRKTEQREKKSIRFFKSKNPHIHIDAQKQFSATSLLLVIKFCGMGCR